MWVTMGMTWTSTNRSAWHNKLSTAHLTARLLPLPRPLLVILTATATVVIAIYSSRAGCLGFSAYDLTRVQCLPNNNTFWLGRKGKRRWTRNYVTRLFDFRETNTYGNIYTPIYIKTIFLIYILVIKIQIHRFRQ